MQTELALLNTSFVLRRYPIQKNEKHQAWDAADEYIIEHMEQINLPSDAHVLIFNDSFGALSCYAAGKGYQVSCINDSHLSQQSIKKNLEYNLGEKHTSVQLLSSIESLPKNIDLVLMKLPKNNRLLIWQLSQLAAVEKKSLSLIAGAKAREIHSSTLSLFEKYLGSTNTSLAKKKARLIFCDKSLQGGAALKGITSFTVPEYQLRLQHYPNVFSAEKLDIAAFLMLEHIPQSDTFHTIIDLGCGNGVLAIQAARKNPQAKIIAVDESHMAVASAQINLLEHGIEPDRIQTVLNNSLQGFEKNSADLVLCNPPFHQQQTVTDHLAWQMFCDARQVLAPQGRLRVIGNRHLGYHSKIKRLFGNAKIIASNAKFVIVEAIKGS